MKWDDVRLFLCLARCRTSRAAARQLGVNQSTISRRLKQLERDAGVQLFERGPAGLLLTDAGEEMVGVAERIEDEFAVLGRQVLGRDVRLGGRIRLSVPDLMLSTLGPILAEFGRRYPAISVELGMQNDYVRLTHREADVAIRLGSEAPEHLVGRRIAAAQVGVYGAPAYLDVQPDPRDLASLDWMGWEETWRALPPERWISANVPAHHVRARTNTNQGLTELIAGGLGVGFLLRLNGDPDPRLRRIAELDFGLSLWLLTHEDIRRTARIAALMRFVGDALMAQRALIEGKGPPGSSPSG